MNDLLTRVWALLAEHERPEGWSFGREQERSEGPWGPARWGEPRFLADGHRRLDPDHVHARLTIAAEQKLLSEGCTLDQGAEKYYWVNIDGIKIAGDPDRLTAAALAIEAGKGGA